LQQALAHSRFCNAAGTVAETVFTDIQAMATDIDKLNMTVPPSPATSVSMYHSDMQTASNTSMNSGAVHDDSSRLSTPISKRQRLSPLELPDFPAQEPCSAQAHRLSDDGRHHMQSPHDTPQAQRLKDAHDKPPVSPNDSCFGMDLRKAALLRSLMLATEGPTSCAIPQHKRQISAQKGKGKAKGKLTQMQRMMPAPTTDSASMEVDCMSDRSSVSPDTASSNVFVAPAQCLNLPVQDKDIYSKPANGSLFQCIL